MHPTYHALTDAPKAMKPTNVAPMKAQKVAPKMKATNGGFDYMGSVKPSNIGLPNSPKLK